MNNTAPDTSRGNPHPLGATVLPGGVNFAIFSRHAESMHLHLYDNPEEEQPSRSIPLSPPDHRTGDVWHVFVEHAGAGTVYTCSVDGSAGLLDPLARAVFKDKRGQRKAVVPDETFDWQGDRPLKTPMERTVIYETHLRGLTIHPSSGVEHPGTYAGFIEKIPYLKNLGITAVELLPVQEFDDNEIVPKRPTQNGPLQNYWGYNTIAFFAPHGPYAASSVPGGQVAEFKELVRSLHEAGIEVILDVVFNHTAEGAGDGPTYNFRGFDNSIYYLLNPKTGAYLDYTGCKNTVNCNHPVVSDFILDCLRYWVLEMHVDGFRFDLAPVLCRDTAGRLMDRPPLVERISEDPVLRDTKLIAEAWDAGGGYLVGRFGGNRWAEWNDRFRDDLRRFWLKDPSLTGAFATRVSGSSDLYFTSGRKPCHSINYISAHDGFTLNDLTQYGRKHNDENGEGGRDGNDGEISDNLGIEGPTVNRAIEGRRIRMVKSLAASLLLSRGTPMILGGDEFRRSQGGNNNAYCQDNETSWYNWYYMKENTEMLEFFRKLIAFRKRNPVFFCRSFYGPDAEWNVRWLDDTAAEVDWKEQTGFLAFFISGTEEPEKVYYVMVNPSKQDVPGLISKPPEGTAWYRVIDTAAAAPEDILPEGEEAPVSPYDSYVVKAGALVVLVTRTAG